LQPQNNARIKCTNLYFAVTNLECIDEKSSIWKGERIIEPGTPSDVLLDVFFSRTYDKDNAVDLMLHEHEITDTSIIGFKFWLIPKEKLLFGYDGPSTIIKAPIKLSKPSMFGGR